MISQVEKDTAQNASLIAGMTNLVRRNVWNF